VVVELINKNPMAKKKIEQRECGVVVEQ